MSEALLPTKNPLTCLVRPRPGGLGGIFVASLDSIKPATLHDHGIACVIAAVSPDALLEHLRRELADVELKVFTVEEGERADISRFFFDAVFLAHHRLSGGFNVLFVSQHGSSRAPALAAAYFIRHGGFTAAAAQRFLAQKLPVLRLNVGFQRQLLALEGFMALQL